MNKHSPKRNRAKGSGLTAFIGFCAEIFFTLGVVFLLFVAWSLWFSNIQADVKQDSMVKEFVQDFAPIAEAPDESVQSDYGDPVVMEKPQYAETFGVVYIPRFGETYYRPLVQGTGTDVLDTLGLGHYQNTTMPGGVGNFSVAGHRQTHGSVLDKIHTLQPGDKIYVQTKDGFYTYVYRNSEIVLPTDIGVINPYPGKTSKPDQRLMTMTSCNPRFGAEERIIAYSMLESWQPLTAGAPAEIAPIVESLKAGK